MGLMKKLTSAIVASSLVLSLVGTAFAAYTPAAGETAGNRMMALKVVNGKTVADPLSLKDEITRAELVTIIVRAFGQEENAKLLVGSPAFPDTTKHWASGNIAMAKALVEKQGDSIGMPDGTFAPDAKLTPAQAVAFLMKFLGVKADATKTWPANYLDAAVTAGLIASGDKDIIAPMLNDNATRGLVFYLFDSAFYSYDLGAGKTFYTKYVDTMGPVLNVTMPEKTTLDSKVTISGKAEGAKEVYVGTTAATLAADGTFSVDFSLPEMKEYTITVTARDIAGNVTEKPVSVTRTVGTIASIEAAAITVAAGKTVDVAAKAVDAKGNALTDVITGESTVGTFAAGKFTAGTTAGTGTLTLKSGEKTADVAVTVTAGALAKVVASAASAAPGGKLTLTTQDEYGNAITGATFAVNSADAMVDPAAGTFVAFKEGSYTVTATKDGATATASIGVYGDTSKLAVELTEKLVANYDANDATNKGSYVTVTVKAQDANGNLIANYAQGVTLAANNGAVVIKGVNSGIATETASKGSASFKVYAPAGLQGQVIKLTATQGTLTAGTANLEVLGQVATTVELKTANDFVGVAAATPLEYTVRILDQKGVQMRSGAWDTKVTVSGVAVLDEQVNGSNVSEYTYAVAGSYTDNLLSKQYTTGAITLTAAVEGLGTASKNVSAVFVGGAKSIAVSANKTEYTAAKVGNDAVTFTANIKDSQGALVPGDALNVDNVPTNLTLDLSHLSTDDFNAIQITVPGNNNPLQPTSATSKKYEIPAIVDNGFETNEYEFTAITISKLVGTVDFKLSGKKGTTELTGANQAVTIKANSANKISLTSTSTKYVPVTAPTTTFTVQVLDTLGNKVAVADKSIVLTAFENTVDGQGADVISATATSDVTFDGTTQTKTYKTDATGAVVVTVAAKQYVGNKYWIAAVSADYAEASNQAKVVVDSTASAGISVTIEKNLLDAQGNVTANWVTPAYVTAGDVVRAVATVTDTYGVGRVNNTNLKITSAEKIFWLNNELVDGAGLGTVAFASAGGGVYTSAPIVVGKSGVVAFTVTEKNAPTTVAADASVLVYAATAAKLAVAEADSSDRIFVTQNSLSGAFTLKLTDMYGNAVTTNSNQTVYVGVGGAAPTKVVQLTSSTSTVGVASTLSTRGSSSFYVGVTDLTKTTTDAATTITFSLDALNANTAADNAVVNVYGK